MYKNLGTKHQNLHTKYQNFGTKYQNFRTNYQNLCTKYQNLRNKYQYLGIKYQNLRTKYLSEWLLLKPLCFSACTKNRLTTVVIKHTFFITLRNFFSHSVDF